MPIVISFVVLVAMGLVGWMILGHFGMVPPLQWHMKAAWDALRLGRMTTGSTAKVPSHGTHVSTPPAIPTGTALHAGYPWGELLIIVAILFVVGWCLWGTVIWLYNTPHTARRWEVWGDWLLWRWPVITAAQTTGHPDWIMDAWARHKRLWMRQAPSDANQDILQRAAQVLDAGFATSVPDVAWMPGSDGLMIRRMTVIADGHGVHPQWAQGLHAQTMAEWSKWAMQWGEIALHHAGIPGFWSVDPEGIVRRKPAGHPSPGAESENPPSKKHPPDETGLDPATRWGREGLPWSVIAPAVTQPLPVLTLPLPTTRITEVIQALGTLGVPDARPEGGYRGLGVDLVQIRPVPAWGKRVRGESLALAGQLGHGDVPLRIYYMHGKPGIMAVERPRGDRQFVDLVTALARTHTEDRQKLQNMAIPICLGVMPDGHVVWSDIATWPHCLIGGTTGSGKTTVLSTMLTCLTITMPPSDLRITIVDPKQGSQFPWVSRMPHIENILTELEDVVSLIAQWADEQEERYKQFAELGVPDLITARQRGLSSLPYRLLMIDEYKDLKDRLDKDALKNFERDISRLGQKARGAGFYLWIATQHPLASTISSTLKANLPTRIALLTSSSSDSQVILDEPGAETLLGKGDAFFRPVDAHELTRVQTPAVLNDSLWDIISNGWKQI